MGTRALALLLPPLLAAIDAPPVQEGLVETYGPLAVFVLLALTGIGVPLGEDVITIPAGILIAHGVLPWFATGVCAYAGVIVSDLLWYGLCFRFGTPLLHKRWFKRLVHPRRLLELKHQIERRGAWVVVMARFIPGSRTPAITAAGVLHFSFRKFALAETLSGLLIIPMQLGLGYAVGRGLGSRETADLVQLLVGAVVLILAVLLVLAWWRRHRRLVRARRPRARAAWLRRFRPARRGG